MSYVDGPNLQAFVVDYDVKEAANLWSHFFANGPTLLHPILITDLRSTVLSFYNHFPDIKEQPSFFHILEQ